jgi:hypothetical protein
MTPIFAGTGSRIMAATLFLFFLNILSRFSKLLNSEINVCLVKSFGTPGEDGDPNVVSPEPALTKR